MFKTSIFSPEKGWATKKIKINYPLQCKSYKWIHVPPHLPLCVLLMDLSTRPLILYLQLLHYQLQPCLYPSFSSISPPTYRNCWLTQVVSWIFKMVEDTSYERIQYENYVLPQVRGEGFARQKRKPRILLKLLNSCIRRRFRKPSHINAHTS